MISDRHRQITGLYHAALERPIDERGTFLRDACAEDEALRAEVESLLAYESVGAPFLATPAANGETLAAMADPDHTMIGRQLGPYRIVARLGAGGMSEVYLADDAKLRRPVAIKVLTGGADHSSSSRLLNEARAASALSHANICTVHEVLETGTQSFLVMEHVKGHALSTMIPRGGQPVETVLHYGAQVADAVAHAHERGIVHRDLKPSNVMITPEGRVKVLDFGIATRYPAGRGEDIPRSRDSSTLAGSLAGTLAYMAPEQFRGMSADERSDIWALGVMLYEMATGELPFGGQNGVDLTAAILTDQPAALPARVPGALATTIMRCLAKLPERRYQRAGEVRAALEAFQSGSLARVAEPSRSWRRVRPWAAALLLMIFVAEGWGIWNAHIVERTLRVPIEFRNIPRQLEIMGDPPTEVDVTLRGPSALLRRLESRDIVAALDLTNARTGSRRMFHLQTNEVRAPHGADVAQVVPGTLVLDLEESGTRTVPIVPALDGEPAPGFVIGRVTSDPPTVQVAGPESRLKQVTQATTEPVSVGGRRDRVRDVVPIGGVDLPVRLIGRGSATVVVEISPGPVKREMLDVPIRCRNLRPGMRAWVSPAALTVTVQGERETVANLRGDAVEAFVDLAALGVGQYNLQVQTDPSERYGVSKVSPSLVVVTIK